jgi:uncharacterized protein YndB with AHSA1/START domain
MVRDYSCFFVGIQGGVRMTFLLVLIILVLGAAVLIQQRPDDFRVTRTATIDAPAQLVFDNIDDLRKWDAWSPWAKLDPNATNNFEGPERGVGSSMSWAGNKEVGVGRMTIVESRPNDFVRFKLEFEKPMKAVNTAEFSLTPNADRTTVSWSMFGRNNFVGKVFGLLMNCEKMVGGQFDKGLASLKAVSEQAAKG